MKKVFVLLFALILLVGCSSNESETLVCKGTTNGVNIENTLTYNGDKVTSQKIVNKLYFGELDVTKEQLESLVAQYEELYDLDGVTYTTKITDDKYLIEEISVDYSKADFKELAKVDLVSSENGDDITYISLEETKKSFVELGLTCE